MAELHLRNQMMTYEQIKTLMEPLQIPAAIGAIIVGAFFSPFKKLFLENKALIPSEIGPTFWSRGKKYRIIAAHKFEKSDSEPSGYIWLSQNSREDQWRKLIKIDSSFMNCRHHVSPLHTTDILTVVISTRGDDRYQNISFNK